MFFSRLAPQEKKQATTTKAYNYPSPRSKHPHFHSLVFLLVVRCSIIMDQALDDGNFWLPAEFLNEEDVFMEFKTQKFTANNMNINTDSSSPDAVTESDEEEYLNELSLKLARSALEDDLWKTDSVSNNHSKSVRVMAGSPQSTLYGCNHVSSRGSSNCPSPPPLVQAESPWDVLSAAAGEVARLRLTEEAGYTHRNNLQVSPQPPRRIPSPNPQFHQINHIQAAQLKKQEMILHQQQQYQQFVLQTRGLNVNGNTKPVMTPLSAWPTLQQSQQQSLSGSGMRAVFLGNPNPKRECTGTGVFLPRQIGAPVGPRKKRGCSTVLLPDRVVHALNLNLEAQTRSNGGLARHDYDAEIRYRNNVVMAEQRRQHAEMDLRLPQEWTY